MATKTATKMPALASGVTYQDSNGRNKAALVIATPDSLHAEGGFSLEAGQVQLSVFGPTGGRYTRTCALGEDGFYHRIGTERDF